MDKFSLRIYWEDTDAGGIVYYANYLKFAERARTEMLRSHGIDQTSLREQYGVAIVVRHCAVEFLAPARLDDTLSVETMLQSLGKVRMTMQQVIYRDGQELVRIEVELACVDSDMKPARMPDHLHSILEKCGVTAGGV